MHVRVENEGVGKGGCRFVFSAHAYACVRPRGVTVARGISIPSVLMRVVCRSVLSAVCFLLCFLFAFWLWALCFVISNSNLVAYISTGRGPAGRTQTQRQCLATVDRTRSHAGSAN